MQARSVFRATGRPSSCAFEGRYAPQSPDTRTNDEPPSPQQRPDAVRGPKQRGEHQPSKLSAWREELSRPRSPASTPRFDVPPEQRSWSLNMSWSHCRPQPQEHATGRNSMQARPQEHATSCNSMQDRPASKTPPVGLHPAAQLRHVHSVKKRRPPQQQQLVPPATRRDTTGGACHTHAGV